MAEAKSVKGPGAGQLHGKLRASSEKQIRANITSYEKQLRANIPSSEQGGEKN